MARVREIVRSHQQPAYTFVVDDEWYSIQGRRQPGGTVDLALQGLSSPVRHISWATVDASDVAEVIDQFSHMLKVSRCRLDDPLVLAALLDNALMEVKL